MWMPWSVIGPFVDRGSWSNREPADRRVSGLCLGTRTGVDRRELYVPKEWISAVVRKAPPFVNLYWFDNSVGGRIVGGRRPGRLPAKIVDSLIPEIVVRIRFKWVLHAVFWPSLALIAGAELFAVGGSAGAAAVDPMPGGPLDENGPRVRGIRLFEHQLVLMWAL
jgi:hypothetical protein